MGLSRSATFVRHGQGKISVYIYLYLLTSVRNESTCLLSVNGHWDEIRRVDDPGMHMNKGIRRRDAGWTVTWRVV